MVREEDLGEVVSVTPLVRHEGDASAPSGPERPQASAAEPPEPEGASDDLRLPDDLAGYEEPTPDAPRADAPDEVEDAFSGSLAARVLTFLREEPVPNMADRDEAVDAETGYNRPVSPGELVARLEDARMRLDSFRTKAARLRATTNGSRGANGVLEIPRRRGEYGGVVEIPKA